MTNVYLSLTADPLAFAHLKTLIEEADANASALGPLLMFSKLEVGCNVSHTQMNRHAIHMHEHSIPACTGDVLSSRLGSVCMAAFSYLPSRSDRKAYQRLARAAARERLCLQRTCKPAADCLACPMDHLSLTMVPVCMQPLSQVGASTQWVGTISSEQARLSLEIMAPLLDVTNIYSEVFSACIAKCINPRLHGDLIAQQETLAEKATVLTKSIGISYKRVFLPDGDLYEASAENDLQGGGHDERFIKRQAFYESLDRLFCTPIPAIDELVSEARGGEYEHCDTQAKERLMAGAQVTKASAKPCMQPLNGLSGWARWLLTLIFGLPKGPALKLGLVNALSISCAACILFIKDFRFKEVLHALTNRSSCLADRLPHMHAFIFTGNRSVVPNVKAHHPLGTALGPCHCCTCHL